MSNLTDFLLARIAEDEADAHLADGVTDKHEDDWQDVTQPITLAETLGRESWAKKYGHAYQHIARHDPARVLAECEAKRRIVEACRADYEYAQGRNDDTTELAEEVMWFLALPYADHPDYRDEWRP